MVESGCNDVKAIAESSCIFHLNCRAQQRLGLAAVCSVLGAPLLHAAVVGGCTADGISALFFPISTLAMKNSGAHKDRNKASPWCSLSVLHSSHLCW